MANKAAFMFVALLMVALTLVACKRATPVATPTLVSPGSQAASPTPEPTPTPTFTPTPTATPTPVPTPTTAVGAQAGVSTPTAVAPATLSPDTRAALVKFLTDLNSIQNGFEDSVRAATQQLLSGNLTDANAISTFITSLSGEVDKYQAGLSLLTPPSAPADAAELYQAQKAAANQVQAQVQQAQAALQSGNPLAVQTALPGLASLLNDPVVNHAIEVQKSILDKYGISDAEVGFRRR